MQREKTKKYVYTDEDLHKLIALNSALTYELQKIENIRKEIAKLRLRKLK